MHPTQPLINPSTQPTAPNNHIRTDRICGLVLSGVASLTAGIIAGQQEKNVSIGMGAGTLCFCIGAIGVAICTRRPVRDAAVLPPLDETHDFRTTIRRDPSQRLSTAVEVDQNPTQLSFQPDPV